MATDVEAVVATAESLTAALVASRAIPDHLLLMVNPRDARQMVICNTATGQVFTATVQEGRFVVSSGEDAR